MRIPNRKMVSLLMLSLSLSLSGAEKLLDWNSTRPDDYGKCRLSKKGALTITKEGAQFNGQDSFLHLGTPKIAESLTIALQVKLTGLPEKQYTFAVRRGFNHTLGCDNQGRVTLEIWGQDKKERIIVRSQQKLVPGKFYNIVSVFDRANNQNQLKLYINGKLEGDARLGTPPFPYDAEVIFGNANPYGKWSFPLKGTLNFLRVYDGIPTGEEWKKLNEVPPPATGSADGTVSVIDFGAVPGDGVDDTAAVRKALAFALENKARRLYFGPGIFDFEEAAGSLWTPPHWVLWLEKVSDLEIDGGGATMMLHGTQCFAWSKNCRNVTFKNMTLDYKEPHFTCGKVTYISPDKYIFDVAFNPVYRPRGGEPVPSWAEEEGKDFLNVNGGLFVCHRVSKTQLVQPNVMRIYASDAMHPLKEGMQLMLRHHIYTGSLFRLHDSVGHKLENINIYAGKGMGIVGQYLDGITLNKIQIRPAPYAAWPLSTSSDAINLLGCYGKISITDCYIKGAKDDSINIFSNYYGVKKVTGGNSILMHNPKFNSGEMPQDKPGDTLLFLHNDFSVYARRTVARIKAVGSQRHCEVEFTESLPAELDWKNDLIMAARQPEQIVIANSKFHSEGRVVLQCGNAIVENCEFIDAAGFQLNTCIAPWYEAAPGNHVVVRKNRFINCGRNGMRKIPAVIAVTAEGPLPNVKDLSSQGAPVPYPVHSDIEISDNLIDKSNNSAMIFTSVRNLVVKNNILRDLSLQPQVKPWQLTERNWNENAVTFVCGIESARFEGNSYQNSKTPKKNGVIAVGDSISNDAISFKDNKNFTILRTDVFPEQRKK